MKIKKKNSISEQTLISDGQCDEEEQLTLEGEDVGSVSDREERLFPTDQAHSLRPTSGLPGGSSQAPIGLAG